MASDPLTFRVPTSRFELINTFLNLSEESQRLYLAAMQLGSSQPGNERVAELPAVLREDGQTRELVARLESTTPAKLPKSKARRRW